MICHKTNARDRVTLMSTVTLDDGSIGDAIDYLLPGETFAGLRYDRWRAMRDGPVDVVFDGRRAVSARPIEPGGG